MPIYEYTKNAENKISIGKGKNDSIVFGTESTIEKIITLIKEHGEKTKEPCIIAFDGNYCVQWETILEKVARVAKVNSLNIEAININSVFKLKEEIKTYKKVYITDDPSFGYENPEGRVQEIMDMSKVKELRSRLQKMKSCKTCDSAVIVYSTGSAIQELIDVYDYKLYFEMTKDPIMWSFWAGELIPLGMNKPDPDYSWKELYYNDFHMLDNQKWYLFEHMDFLIDAVEPSDLTMIPRNEYDAMITTLLDHPIKQVKVFMPGPWGAYRTKDLWDVKGLENCAWNNIASPKLDLIIEIENGKKIRLPSVNLLQYGEKLVGKYWNEEVPKWWPIIAAIDDGYFPDKDTPLERTAMPVHNHPTREYVRRNFNEQFGRYETYYIVEAYEGSKTLMGFKDDADLEEWESKCREADLDKSLIPDWKNYIQTWDTSAGDLFLIPPGTSHGHGGRQMVLELDTTVNTTTCEYSFFMHDYGRNTWDDSKKSMTGNPMKLHNNHGFNTEKWCRASWVKDHLRAKPKVVKWTKDYSVEIYSSLPEMPFHIERFHFSEFAENDTEGRFMQIVTLTVGKNITIRSKKNPQRQTTIEWLQAAIIPASFGEYEFVNNNDDQCTVVQIRMKRG